MNKKDSQKLKEKEFNPNLDKENNDTDERFYI